MLRQDISLRLIDIYRGSGWADNVTQQSVSEAAIMYAILETIPDFTDYRNDQYNIMEFVPIIERLPRQRTFQTPL
jgi:hypothetical protein